MTAIVFFNGRFLPESEVHISPRDRGWLLGDGVYEAAPSYRGRFLRLDRHLDRLRSSLTKLRIDETVLDELAAVPDTLIASNGLTDAPRALAYIQVTRGVAPRTHAFPNPPVRPTVFGYVAPFAPKIPADIGASVRTERDFRWGRCDIKTISLVANCLANQAAQDARAYETIFIRDGLVQEGTHTNVFAIRSGALITPPLTPYILPGVTREIVLDLARAAGVPVREQPMTEGELVSADEVFLTGTTTEVLPVVRIDDARVGEGMMGAVTSRLRSLFEETTGLALRPVVQEAT